MWDVGMYIIGTCAGTECTSSLQDRDGSGG